MADVSRRAMLTAGGLTVAAALVPAFPAGASATAAGRAQFQAALGSWVTLRTASGRIRARVAEVTDLAGAPAGAADRYSVLLQPERPVPDGIYAVSSASVGRATLFLANVDRRAAAGLQAIVNTFIP